MSNIVNLGINTIVQDLTQKLVERSLCVCTAESCTGGALAQAMTELAGSSQWFERGFVTYSNEAKMDLLGVSGELLAAYGAVSEQSVSAMAAGALHNSRADIAIAITGIAGPTGGSVDKPVGTVWFAWLHKTESYAHTHCEQLLGDRGQVRTQAVIIALQGISSRYLQS